MNFSAGVTTEQPKEQAATLRRQRHEKA